MPLVWITGVGGLIGHYLLQTASPHAAAWQVVALSRPQLDLTALSAVTCLFAKCKPHLVIHCAALSKSPACQANPKLAWTLNVDTTRHLAELASDISFVFFS